MVQTFATSKSKKSKASSTAEPCATTPKSWWWKTKQRCRPRSSALTRADLQGVQDGLHPIVHADLAELRRRDEGCGVEGRMVGRFENDDLLAGVSRLLQQRARLVEIGLHSARGRAVGRSAHEEGRARRVERFIAGDGLAVEVLIHDVEQGLPRLRVVEGRMQVVHAQVGLVAGAVGHGDRRHRRIRSGHAADPGPAQDRVDPRQQLVDCIRMLEKADIIDHNGHVSIRYGDNLLINNGSAVKGLLTQDDLVEIDMDGNVVSGKGKPPLEFHIHTEIYRARPDVQAVAHTHPKWSTFLTMVGKPYKHVYAQGVLLGDMPVFGGLFQYKTRSRSKTNLMVFLRPVVLRTAEAADTLMQDRYRTLREQQGAADPRSRGGIALPETPSQAGQTLFPAPAVTSPAPAPTGK